MQHDVRKLSISTGAAIPLMAAVPYLITLSPEAASADTGYYDPVTQLTMFAGRSGCFCREDESTDHWFKSKSDSKKDD